MQRREQKRPGRIRLAGAALAALLVIGLWAGQAFAYFTAFTSASGRVPLHLGVQTEIEEPSVDTENMIKHVVVSNSGPESCWVRVKVFAPSAYQLTYEGTGWKAESDGYVYCTQPLGDSETSPELLVKISGLPEGAAEGETAHVVVVYESTKVQAGPDGTPLPADWSMAAVVTEGGQD